MQQNTTNHDSSTALQNQCLTQNSNGSASTGNTLQLNIGNNTAMLNANSAQSNPLGFIPINSEPAAPARRNTLPSNQLRALLTQDNTSKPRHVTSTRPDVVTCSVSQSENAMSAPYDSNQACSAFSFENAAAQVASNLTHEPVTGLSASASRQDVIRAVLNDGFVSMDNVQPLKRGLAQLAGNQSETSRGSSKRQRHLSDQTCLRSKPDISQLQLPTAVQQQQLQLASGFNYNQQQPQQQTNPVFLQDTQPPSYFQHTPQSPFSPEVKAIMSQSCDQQQLQGFPHDVFPQNTTNFADFPQNAAQGPAAGAVTSFGNGFRSASVPPHAAFALQAQNSDQNLQSDDLVWYTQPCASQQPAQASGDVSLPQTHDAQFIPVQNQEFVNYQQQQQQQQQFTVEQPQVANQPGADLYTAGSAGNSYQQGDQVNVKMEDPIVEALQKILSNGNTSYQGGFNQELNSLFNNKNASITETATTNMAAVHQNAHLQQQQVGYHSVNATPIQSRSGTPVDMSRHAVDSSLQSLSYLQPNSGVGLQLINPKQNQEHAGFAFTNNNVIMQ